MSNHLGNVLTTITDKKLQQGKAAPNESELDYFTVDVASATDYYPFGMSMPGRKVESSSYRYGFNGQEKSTELDPNGNSMTAEFWQYDARLGRRWNVDPKGNSALSSYSAFANSPIFYCDPLGDTIINGQRVEAMNASAATTLENIVISAPTRKYHKPLYPVVDKLWDKEQYTNIQKQSEDLARLVYKQSELYKKIQQKMPKLPSLPDAQAILREYAGKDLSQAADLLLEAKDRPVQVGVQASIWALTGRIHPIVSFGVNNIIDNIMSDLNYDYSREAVKDLDRAWSNTEKFSSLIYGTNRFMSKIGDYLDVISVTQKQMSEIMDLKFFIPSEYSRRIIYSRHDIHYSEVDPPRFYIYFNRLSKNGFLHISEVGIAPISF